MTSIFTLELFFNGFCCRVYNPNSMFLDGVWILQSTGAYKAASRLAIATPPPAYVLSRGIGWQVQPMDSVINLCEMVLAKKVLRNVG